MQQSDPPSIKLVIVDDVRMFAEGLSALLGTISQLEVAGIALSGEEALQLCAETRPDVILMDISMPKQDGITSMQQLLSIDPSYKVLMLTVDDDFASISESLQKGARGYVLKENDLEELYRAIREVAAGRRYFDPRVADAMVEHLPDFLANRAKSSKTDSDDCPLTPREKDILQLMSEGKTSDAIAKTCFLSIHTVETHRKNILGKLGASNAAEAILLGKKHSCI